MNLVTMVPCVRPPRVAMVPPHHIYGIHSRTMEPGIWLVYLHLWSISSSWIAWSCLACPNSHWPTEAHGSVAWMTLFDLTGLCYAYPLADVIWFCFGCEPWKISSSKNSSNSHYSFRSMLQDRLTVNQEVYPTITVALQKIYKDGGVGAFYAGISPTLIGMLPYSTCYYFMYETMKKSYCQAKKKKALNRAELLLVGALSGENLALVFLCFQMQKAWSWISCVWMLKFSSQIAKKQISGLKTDFLLKCFGCV